MLNIIIVYFLFSALLILLSADDFDVLFDENKNDKLIARFRERVRKARFKVTKRIAQENLDDFIASMDEVQGARKFFSDKSMKALFLVAVLVSFLFGPIFYLKKKAVFIYKVIKYTYEDMRSNKR